MTRKTLMTALIGGVFALTAFAPVIIHADSKCMEMKYEPMDPNNDGKISKQEFMTSMQDMYVSMDEDESGFVSRTEFLSAGH
jgi:Ca2+-binding EF-hand superfamily protein